MSSIEKWMFLSSQYEYYHFSILLKNGLPKTGFFVVFKASIFVAVILKFFKR